MQSRGLLLALCLALGCFLVFLLFFLPTPAAHLQAALDELGSGKATLQDAIGIESQKQVIAHVSHARLAYVLASRLYVAALILIIICLVSVLYKSKSTPGKRVRP
jgi:hypothetical protein